MFLVFKDIDLLRLQRQLLKNHAEVKAFSFRISFQCEAQTTENTEEMTANLF